MSGYWRAEQLNREVFDHEGFLRTGDALKPLDEADPSRGFLFDGRLAEDFKLSSGTFVSVGPLRARMIAAGAPYIQDVVLAGINQDFIAAIVFSACRCLHRARSKSWLRFQFACRCAQSPKRACGVRRYAGAPQSSFNR